MTKREIFTTESFVWKELESSDYELYYRNKLWRIVFFAVRQANYILIPTYSFLKRVARYLFRTLFGKVGVTEN